MNLLSNTTWGNFTWGATSSGVLWEQFLQDGLGSVRAITDAAGVVQQSFDYDPYGDPLQAMDGFAFTGEYRDENGLQYHRARYYDPMMGIFPSLDPFEGIHNRPMSLNGYSWVEGNVVMGTDATGRVACLPREIRNELIAYNLDKTSQFMQSDFDFISTDCPPNWKRDYNGSAGRLLCQSPSGDFYGGVNQAINHYLRQRADFYISCIEGSANNCPANITVVEALALMIEDLIPTGVSPENAVQRISYVILGQSGPFTILAEYLDSEFGGTNLFLAGAGKDTTVSGLHNDFSQIPQLNEELEAQQIRHFWSHLASAGSVSMVAESVHECNYSARLTDARLTAMAGRIRQDYSNLTLQSLANQVRELGEPFQGNLISIWYTEDDCIKIREGWENMLGTDI